MMRFSLTAALLLVAGQALACQPLRVGYTDQHRPPYYLGAGGAFPNPPGASVELLKGIVESGGCRVQFVRLPLKRIRPALEAGLIDAAPVDASDRDPAIFMLPRDRDGKPDGARALTIYNIVFVRAADKLPADLDPNVWLRGRTMGTAHGAPYAAEFRKAGIHVDDGAMDVTRNLDKLLRKRIDAFGTSATRPDELDHFVQNTFGDAIVRLDKPMRTSFVYFAVNKDYYARNRTTVDAMWVWIGSSGRQRFDQLLKKYAKR